MSEMVRIARLLEQTFEGKPYFGDYTCFGNCIWDALGIPAMLKKDAVVKTACGDCDSALQARVTGGVLSLDQGWRLAQAWYGPDRREPDWRRKTVEEAEALFADLGLTSEFWRLR